MNQTSARRLRRAVFTALFLVAFFCAAQAALDHRLAARVSRTDFRFLVHDMTGYPELKRHLCETPGHKVLFVGDSILQGAAMTGGARTIAYGYYEGLPPAERSAIRVVNGGLAGASLEENRLLANDLAAADFETVLLILNYRALARGGVSALYAKWLSATPPTRGSAFARATGAIDDLLRRRVSLYRNRQLLLGSLWGAPPDRGLSRFYYVAALVGWRDAVAREFQIGPPRLWSGSQWNAQTVQALRSSFAIPMLDRKHRSLRSLAALATEVKLRGSRFVVVAPPFNNEMARRYDLIDTSVQAHNLNLVREIVTARGGGFVDARTWQPENVFADSVHMIGAGNLAFGRQLAAWHAGVKEATP